MPLIVFDPVVDSTLKVNEEELTQDAAFSTKTETTLESNKVYVARDESKVLVETPKF